MYKKKEEETMKNKKKCQHANSNVVKMLIIDISYEYHELRKHV
jgi:hypothetical protein